MRSILFCFAVALAICDILGGSRLANAGSIVIEVNDGSGWMQVAVGPSSGPAIGATTYTTTNGAFKITGIAASSNSPGTASDAKLMSSTVSVLHIGGTTDELLIAIGAQDFTKPVTPPSLRLVSHIDGTVQPPDNGNNKLTFQSWVDPANGLGQAGATGFTPGLQTLNAQKPFNDDADTTISSLSATYSLTELLDITLGGASDLTFTANTTLSPVPEPPSIVLLGFGAAGMLGYGWKRRQVTA